MYSSKYFHLLSNIFLCASLVAFSVTEALVPPAHSIKINIDQAALLVKVKRKVEKLKKSNDSKTAISLTLDVKEEIEKAIGYEIDLKESIKKVSKQFNKQGKPLNENYLKAIYHQLKKKEKKRKNKKDNKWFSFRKSHEEDEEEDEDDIPTIIVVGVTLSLCGVFLFVVSKCVPVPIPGLDKYAAEMIKTGILGVAADLCAGNDKNKKKDREKEKKRKERHDEDE